MYTHIMLHIYIKSDLILLRIYAVLDVSHAEKMNRIDFILVN